MSFIRSQKAREPRRAHSKRHCEIRGTESGSDATDDDHLRQCEKTSSGSAVTVKRIAHRVIWVARPLLGTFVFHGRWVRRACAVGGRWGHYHLCMHVVLREGRAAAQTMKCSAMFMRARLSKQPRSTRSESLSFLLCFVPLQGCALT